LLKVKDKWFRFVVVFIPFLFTVYISQLLEKVTPFRIWSVSISLVVIIIICETSRILVYRAHSWFPSKFRPWLVLLIGVTFTTFMIALSVLSRKFISTGHWDPFMAMESQVIINDKKVITGVFGYSLLNGLVNFLVLMLGFEILYKQAQFRHSEKEKEKLEKEKLKAELLQLKGIVNPHFLFNNLNSLSSLIAEDPAEAQGFLDELTKVFRYLLRNNQTELTPLSEELKFIQTYYQLLRTRYGNAISMSVHVDPGYETLMLPPLTLQLLIENAVKHNKLQKNNVLEIELRTTSGDKLVVSNTLATKEGKVESTGIGLQTINARYRILNRPGLVIQKDDKKFSVVIPLLNEG
jgi:two-component system, LytTR family, sensor kinase